MIFSTCCRGGFKSLSRAAAKAAASKFRSRGLLQVDVSWARKAELCERCPMRVIQNKITYCGRPFLQQTDRDPARDGCGCPTIAKAKTPGEHCPLSTAFGPAMTTDTPCNCRWCALEKHQME